MAALDVYDPPIEVERDHDRLGRKDILFAVDIEERTYALEANEGWVSINRRNGKWDYCWDGPDGDHDILADLLAWVIVVGDNYYAANTSGEVASGPHPRDYIDSWEPVEKRFAPIEVVDEVEGPDRVAFLASDGTVYVAADWFGGVDLSLTWDGSVYAPYELRGASRFRRNVPPEFLSGMRGFLERLAERHRRDCKGRIA